MNQKKSKISVKVSLYTALLQIIAMGCLFVFVSFFVSENIKETAINTMQTICIDRATIIEDYVRSSEEFLTAYSRAGEITDLLYAPDSPDNVAAAQKYTETFSADKEHLDGIYTCDWNTKVLVHTNPSVPGMVMRKNDTLTSLQNALLNADGVYNTGIILSPASQKQVISMYRACYDANGKPMGFTGGAIYTDGIFQEVNDLPKNGLENSHFYLVNVKTGEYIYHSQEEKTATIADESYILDILSRVQEQAAKTDGYAEYKIDNARYLSCYHYMSDKGWVFIMEDAEEEVYAAAREMKTILFILCLLAAIATILLLFLFLINTLKPLAVINKAINRLSDGDISDSDEASGYETQTDELGQISRSVSNLQKHLKGIVSEIVQNTTQLDSSNQEFSNRFTKIHSSVGGINSAVGKIAVGATNQAQDTVDAKNSIQAIAEEVKRNSDNAACLDSAVVKTAGLFDNMSNILNDLTNISEKTGISIEEVAAKTQATNQSSEKIKEAIDLIKNITSQTNLLSLNASIEAARAGDSGRGFAVVADEIRKLADESSQSAEDIERLVVELVNNSNASIAETIKLNEILEKQKNELKLTSDGFHSLKKEVESVESASRNINDSNEKMERQQQSLYNIVENLSAISEENATSCEETSATMDAVADEINTCSQTVHALTELSHNLKSQTAYFKL